MSNSIAIRFFVWFLAEMPFTIVEAGKDLIVWCWRFFSIGFFLPRLFSPWHKDITSYGRGFDLKVWGRAFTWNFISRIIGAILRLFFICLGTALEIMFVALTFIAVVFWCALPVVIFFLIFTSLIN